MFPMFWFQFNTKVDFNHQVKKSLELKIQSKND